MSAAAPWSVKGIDPKAREIAKDLARRSGMTLGEWLNSMIMDEPEEDDGVATLPRRSPIPDPYDRRSRARRLEDAYGEEDAARASASLGAIADRLEAAERRSTVAIQGIDQAVAGLVRRMDGGDRADAERARRLDDIAEELREGHRRLRHVERDLGPGAAEAVARVDSAVTAVSSRLYDIEERQKAASSELRARMEAVERAAGPGAGSERLAEAGARLDQAQAATSEALKALEESFAALDRRLREAEGRMEPAHAREAARFEKLAETLARQVETSRGEMIRRLDAVETEGRMERIERALAEIGDQARAAERRSAQAVEAMGREVMRIARNLNGRVKAVETAGPQRLDEQLAALDQKLDRELARHAQTVDQRLIRAEDQHALALERLGGEIARISDRLSERIAQTERRSAQALDDIGRRLAESAEKFESRYDRASGELAERMRQSEERTGRLLAEARESMAQRSERAAPRPDLPREAPEAAPWSPAEAPAADWRAVAFADRPEDQAEPASLWPAEAGPDAPAPFPGAAGVPLFGADDAGSAAPFGADPLEEAETQHLGFAADDGFSGLPPLEALQDEFSGESEFIDLVGRGPAEAEREASTRDVLEAARAALTPAEESRDAFGLKPRRGGKSRLQERLDKQAGREGATIRKALGASAVAVMVVGGGYASLQLAEGAALPFGPLRGAAAAAPETPIAALALTAAPADAVPSPDAGSDEGAALFARAVALIDNGDESGLEPLRRAAELGHVGAQMRLAALYAEGGAGLEPDPAEARAWSRRAAEGGEPRAMHHYALQLYDGEGGGRDEAQALDWMRKAAEAGRVDSQYNVARLYETGVQERAADRVEAFKWYMIAARRGDQQALAAVQRLTPALSSAERRTAREAADAFHVEPAA